MSELIEFLRARLDEDQQAAEQAQAEASSWWWNEPESAPERHIARHKPARVLREVEAKRATLDVHHAARFGGDGHPLNSDCCAVCCWDNPNGTGYDRAADDWPCTTIRLLALPYSDHSDYREDWRP